MKIFNVLMVLAAAGTLSACATAIRGVNDTLQINSNPSGAQVKSDNGFYCPSTPCSIRMPRKSKTTLTITKDGYQPAYVTIGHHVSGGGGAEAAANLLFGGVGVVGTGVDVVTGAPLDLDPNPVFVTLDPVK